MNGSQQAAAGGESCIPWRQVIAILAAAVVLGSIYNVASPLGVRTPKAEGAVTLPTTSPITPTHSPIASAPANSINSTATPAASPTNTSALRWTDVKPLLESGQIVLVDARSRTAYDLEYIPGALSLPTESKPEEFVAFAMKHPLDTPIVVYCGGETCDQSHELAQKLRNDLGYTNVKEMPGGIVEWRLAEGKAAAPTSK